jgi:SAM-dependent methyltransferase
MRSAEMHDGVFVVESIAVDYPVDGHAVLGFEGGTGYWFDHRARAVVDVLTEATDARTIWDVGAGTGAMSLRLARAGYEVVAVEPLLAGATAIAKRQIGPVFCGSLEALHLPDACLPIVGLFDVVEHLGDPSLLLGEVRRVLQPDGVVVVTVPALQALWSSSDESAGHHRRFTRSSLDTLMQANGFEPSTSGYIFASLVLPAFLLRALPYRLGRRRTPEQQQRVTSKQLAANRNVDFAIAGVLRAEASFARHVRLPAGLSIVGLYRGHALGV